MTDTPKPQQGTWTLTAPDGRAWKADSPIACVRNEQRERVPAAVALQRIMTVVAVDVCELCGEPMPLGEGMFRYHGHSGPCPAPRAPVTTPAVPVCARCLSPAHHVSDCPE